MRKETWTLIFFWTALISSWLTFVFFFTAPFGLIYWVIILIILIIRRSKTKWYLLAFSAWTFIPTCNFLNGTKDYFTGQATLKHFGLPTREFYNLDKDYRTWKSTSGCIVMGFEPLTQLPNNFAVKFWTNLLGYQRGVYRGIYPDKSDAVKMIERNGEEVEILKSGAQITFRINNIPVQVKRIRHWDTKELDSCKTAKVFIVGNELIIIKPIFRTDVLYLADNNTGSIFAEYEYSDGTNR
jgi:hypothetical protein